MQRRQFMAAVGGVAISVFANSRPVRAADDVESRIGMGTVIFRSRFPSTKPKDVARIDHALSLFDVPGYYRERFGVRQLEFWSHHFDSLEESYLRELRDRIAAAGATLINVQVDGDYDLASTDEDVRQQSLERAKRWIDAVAIVGSRAIRINPGKSKSSVERSIASMKELNRYCQAKGLPLLTENHFGIEMDPDVHLRIREEAGPENIYTLPDFGNYPGETMWESLEKILPHAYLISAKAVDFDADGRHLSYDFDRCVRMAERAGFKGIYLVEQWSRNEQPYPYDKIADWLLERVRANLRAPA